MTISKKKYDRAEQLFRDGNYAESELVCRKILQKRPKDFFALHLLGLNQGKQGKVDQAIATLEKAKRVHHNDSELYSNLGNFYLVAGRVREAIDSCATAVHIDPGHGFAHHNLGNALMLSKRLVEAEQAFIRAQALIPGDFQLLNSMGYLLFRQGRFMEAVQQFIQIDGGEESSINAFVSLFNIFMFMHNTEDASRVAEIGLESGRLKRVDELALVIGQAKVCWLTGRIDQVRSALEGSKEIFAPCYDADEFMNLRVYHQCLDRLLAERDMHPELYAGQPEQAIFFVSESHCLSPSETVVRYQGQEYRILSALITGCKIWHLQAEAANEYKASLAELFKAIPTGSLVILGFGEIDCRWNEGILTAYRRKGIDFTQTIPVVVRRYLECAKTLAEPNRHSLMVYGVPAPSETVLRTVAVEDAGLLIDIVGRVNQALGEEARRRGLDFLDVYAATNDGTGRSNMRYHIDLVHLHPGTVRQLFESFLVPGLSG